MLSIETRDTWAYNLLVTVGAGSDTYTATATSAYASILALVTWCNAAGRPWYGTRTFTWSWARDTATGGAILTMTATGTFTIGASALAALGLPASGPVTSVAGAVPALGTWAPKRIDVSGYYRLLEDAGDASATGAIRPGCPAKAPFKPDVTATGTAQDAARLTYLLGRASNPRRAWAYRQDVAAWVYLALGAVGRDQHDGTLYGFTLETRGHA